MKKSLSTRTHTCQCGYVEDRDIAASINILQKGLCTVGHTGTYAWGDLPSWAVGANLPSNGESLNQESPSALYATGGSVKKLLLLKETESNYP
jgi:putative transposase